MNKLKVMTQGGVKFVFCWNEAQGKIITTNDPAKALPESAKDYFKRKDGNAIFV